MITCPICNVLIDRRVREHVRSGKSIKVFRCDGCVLEFLETWTDTRRAADYYISGQYVYKPNVTGEPLKFDEYNARFNRIQPYLSSRTRLLEIGPGPGLFLSLVRDYVAEAHAVELAPSYVADLRRQGYVVYDRPIEEIDPDQPYDVICMFALLEHVPKVQEFLGHLKRFLHPKSMVFIEVPDLLDPLCTYYDVPEYRDFYYREYHLYYFTKQSLQRLLDRSGFESEFQHLMQASLTNHFHWMHAGTGQPNTNAMVNVTLPRPLRYKETPGGKSFLSLLDKLDDEYRRFLTAAGIGDLLACRAWLTR